jgi:hypothetical protein
LARDSKKHDGRWQWVDLPGPKGRESAGIVDILSILKKWDIPAMEEFKNLKHLDKRSFLWTG